PSTATAGPTCPVTDPTTGAPPEGAPGSAARSAGAGGDRIRPTVVTPIQTPAAATSPPKTRRAGPASATAAATAARANSATAESAGTRSAPFAMTATVPRPTASTPTVNQGSRPAPSSAMAAS